MFLSPLFRKAVLCCLPVSLLGSLALADGPLFVTNGGEYSLSGPLAGDQANASLAISATGGFLVFEDNGGDGSGLGIGAIALDSNYNPVGARFRVNQNRSGDQEHPQAALLANGGMAIVWQSRPKTSARHMFARFLSSSNTWLTGDIMVNTSTKDSQINPVIAALPNGNVVIAYGSFNQVGNGSMQDVYAQVFTPSGQAVSGEFLVNQFTSYNQRTPALAALASGGFVLTWVSEQQRFPNVIDIYGRLYSASGAAVTSEFLINTGTTNICANPGVVSQPGGGFIVGWGELDSEVVANGWDVFARPFSSAGVGGAVVQLNSFTHGNQYAPRFAELTSGLLSLWTSAGQDGSREGVFGRFLNPDGTLAGPEFGINKTVAGPQKFPTVASDGNSRLLAAWSSFTQVGAGFDVYAQLYTTTDYIQLAAATNFSAPKSDPFPTDNINGGGNGGGPTTPPGGPGSGTNGVPKGMDAARGIYYGEFFTGNGDDVASAGSFTATINAKNGFSAKLVLGGKTYSITGKLDADGKVTAAVKKTSLTLEFTLDLAGGNRIDGTLSGNGWSADLHAMRFSKSKATASADFSGSYTLRIPADAANSDSPQGDGFATVRIDLGQNPTHGLPVRRHEAYAEMRTFRRRLLAPVRFPLLWTWLPLGLAAGDQRYHQPHGGLD